MALHPKTAKDLALAPVAANIDMNLQQIRDRSQDEIMYELELVLDRRATRPSRAERARLILDYATRNLDLHDWNAEVTEDSTRLRLSGGSVSLELGLSAELMKYIEG